MGTQPALCIDRILPGTFQKLSGETKNPIHKKNEKCIQLHEQESFLECNLTISIHTLKNLNCTAIKELLCTRLRRIIRCLELQHAAQRGWNQDYSKDFNNKYEMDKLHMTLPFHASKNNLSYCFIQVLRIKKI